MSALMLHFNGGPMDGQMLAWPEAPPSFRVPIQPIIRWWDPADPSELIVHQDRIYERRPGVVANEAVYDWLPRVGDQQP